MRKKGNKLNSVFFTLLICAMGTWSCNDKYFKLLEGIWVVDEIRVDGVVYGLAGNMMFLDSDKTCLLPVLYNSDQDTGNWSYHIEGENVYLIISNSNSGFDRRYSLNFISKTATPKIVAELKSGNLFMKISKMM